MIRSITPTQGTSRIVTNHLENGSDGVSIVSLSVTLRAMISDANKLVGRIIGILGMHLAKDSALVIKQHRGFVSGVDIPLSVDANGIDIPVNVSLAPGLDVFRGSWAALKYDLALDGSDSDIDVTELCVIDDDGSGKSSVESGGLNEDRSVFHDGVDDTFAFDLMVYE